MDPDKKILKKLTALTASAVMTVSAVGGTSIVNFTSTAAGGGDDYAKLLQYSLYFYDANYCGPQTSERTRLTWRDDCHTNDAVSGGFHDAGDHVKFGLPAGYTASNLGWSYYEFGDSFDSTGQTGHLREITDHFAEFFRNSTTLNGSTVTNFVYQVGDGNRDHEYWRSPEKDNDNSTRSALSTSNGASDIAAQYAAALALNYINFGNDEDLKYAKALYEFSAKNNTITSAPGFYESTSLNDDQAWAAGWLYMATQDSYYKNECTSKRPEIYWYNNWDNNSLAANCVYGYVTGDWNKALSFLRGECYSSDYKFANEWGSARYNTELQFCALVTSRHTDYDFNSWAKGQMDYIIGNKGVGSALARCFVVGFADNSVKYPHHRGASGFSSMDEFNSSGTSYGNNGHTLTGALVGGPTDTNGSYTDSVKDYQANEVALDYNAGLVGAAAGLYSAYGTGSIVPISEIPEVKSDITDPEPSETRPVTTVNPVPVVTTATPVVITPGVHKIEINKTHTLNSGDQWESWYWHEFEIGKNETVTKVKVELEASNGSIGNWQGAFGTTSRSGDWMQTSNLSYNFESSGTVIWEPESADAEIINYDSGELRFGTWWSSSQSFIIKSVTVYTNSAETVTTTTNKPTTTTAKHTTITAKPTTTTAKPTTTTAKPTTTTAKLTTATDRPTTTTAKPTTTTAKPTTTTAKPTTTTAKPTTTTAKPMTTTAKPTTTTAKPTTTTANPTTTTQVPATTTTVKLNIKGDINDDGRVSIADLVSLQYYLIGRDNLNSSEFQTADINEDNTVDVFDLILLRKLAAGK